VVGVSTRSTDPRSPWGVFSTVFALTALPFGVMMGAIYKDLSAGIVSGFLFGLLFGAVMIPFLRVERHTLPVTDRSAFEKRLKIEMSELGYTPTRVDEDYLQFRAPTAGVWEFGPLKNMSTESLSRVSVHLDKAVATIVGPRWMVRKVIARI
jgi:hypothetical protein